MLCISKIINIEFLSFLECSEFSINFWQLHYNTNIT